MKPLWFGINHNKVYIPVRTAAAVKQFSTCKSSLKRKKIVVFFKKCLKMACFGVIFGDVKISSKNEEHENTFYSTITDS